MQTVQYRWAVRALNPKQNKNAVDHLMAGYAYYLLSPPSDSQKFYVVGYKNFTGELSTGSEWANQYQIDKLNSLDRSRYGIDKS